MLKVPFGVVIGISFTPPVRRSSRPVLSKYALANGALAAGPAALLAVHDERASAPTISHRICFMLCLLGGRQWSNAFDSKRDHAQSINSLVAKETSGACFGYARDRNINILPAV